MTLLLLLLLCLTFKGIESASEQQNLVNEELNLAVLAKQDPGLFGMGTAGKDQNQEEKVDNAVSFVKRRDIALFYKQNNPEVDLENFPLIANNPLYPFFYDNYITTFDAKELLNLGSANENEKKKAFQNLLFSSHKYSLTLSFIQHLLLPPKMRNQNLSELKNIPANFSMKDFKRKCESYLTYPKKGLITKFQEWKYAQKLIYPELAPLDSTKACKHGCYRSFFDNEVIRAFCNRKPNGSGKELIGKIENENSLSVWVFTEAVKQILCQGYIDKSIKLGSMRHYLKNSELLSNASNLLTKTSAPMETSSVLLKKENYKVIIDQMVKEIEPNVEGKEVYFGLSENAFIEERLAPSYLVQFPSLHRFFFPFRHFEVLNLKQIEKNRGFLDCLVISSLLESKEETKLCYIVPKEENQKISYNLKLKFFIRGLRNILLTPRYTQLYDHHLKDAKNLNPDLPEDRYAFSCIYKSLLEKLPYSISSIQDLSHTLRFMRYQHGLQAIDAQAIRRRIKNKSSLPLFFIRLPSVRNNTLLYKLWKMEEEKHIRLEDILSRTIKISKKVSLNIFETELWLSSLAGENFDRLKEYSTHPKSLFKEKRPHLLTLNVAKNNSKISPSDLVEYLMKETDFSSDWAWSQLESMEILAHKTWDKKCAKAGIPQTHLAKDPLFKAVKEFLELSRDSNKKVCLFAKRVLKELEKNAPEVSQEAKGDSPKKIQQAKENEPESPQDVEENVSKAAQQE